MNDRIFVVDHMVAQPFGHNLNCVNLFSEYFAKSHREVIKLVSKNLPQNVEDSNGVHRELIYPYNGLVETKYLYGKFPKKRNPFLSNLIRLSNRAFFHAIGKVFHKDLMLDNVASDWQRIFAKYKIGKSDRLFFSSVDFYGAMGLLNFLEGWDQKNRPSIHFRFIGVMENASNTNRTARHSLIKKIISVRESRFCNLSLSAETPAYCNYLEKILGEKIVFSPYPLAQQWNPTNWDKNQLCLSSPGQGRADKGYFEIYEIAQALYKISDAYPSKIFLQSMRTSDPFYSFRHQRLLEQVPNLKILPERLSQDKIDDLYRQADIMLLPYAQDIYALRGSAVYQEAMAAGRMVICSDNTGITDLVNRYGNGLVARDTADFERCFIELAKLKKPKILKTTKKARQQYEADLQAGMNAILESMKND